MYKTSISAYANAVTEQLCVSRYRFQSSFWHPRVVYKTNNMQPSLTKFPLLALHLLITRADHFSWNLTTLDFSSMQLILGHSNTRCIRCQLLQFIRLKPADCIYSVKYYSSPCDNRKNVFIDMYLGHYLSDTYVLEMSVL